jgi:hypothetical protein
MQLLLIADFRPILVLAWQNNFAVALCGQAIQVQEVRTAEGLDIPYGSSRLKDNPAEGPGLLWRRLRGRRERL